MHNALNNQSRKEDVIIYHERVFAQKLHAVI